MGESRRSRLHLGAAAAVGYAVVFAALCTFHVPAIALAAYFVIPTALVAIAGGALAGAGGSMLSMLLVLLAGVLNADSAASTTLSFATSGRMVALLSTGVLVGWFADRNRQLLAELRLGAEHDPLTGLGNYRYYEAAVERRVEAGQTFALLLCDMDQLKDVNDGHGHSAGDAALRRLAATLQSLARPGDEVARIGGDEFCVVAAVDGPEQAAALAARFERYFASARCPATLGWASLPFEAASARELFQLADERLYARKASRSGKLRPVSQQSA
ncbi:MAG TPA: GGDEF domain-containing protein [Gaiellaceae bacterium]|nr:GGDEF domain-containing protein [Gaiellaceae bacterium]